MGLRRCWKLPSPHDAVPDRPPRSPARLTLVFAHWCPHCDPVSLEYAPRLARRLGVPLRLLDLDRPAEERLADDLVREHGGWTEDYLIPQLFLEWTDSSVTHLLTGIPGDPDRGTRAEWQRLLEQSPDSLRAGEPG